MEALNSYPICSLMASMTFRLVSIEKLSVGPFTYAGRRDRQFADRKCKSPALVSKRGAFVLATSYSRTTYRRTTIGAAAFHFRVRNGNGWCHCAMITRSLHSGRGRLLVRD